MALTQLHISLSIFDIDLTFIYRDRRPSWLWLERGPVMLKRLAALAGMVAANTWYRTRFEAVGTQLRVYINDSLVLEATDASHASGRYGPVMYRAGMEYDDILAVQP